MARILVAEDDPMQAELVTRYLTREGHEVDRVDRGDLALEAVRRSDPQLVVLDVMLPVIDGLSVCRVLREEDREMPVLMLTARTAENDLLLGLELGADDYLTKPYSPRELVARVRALLRRAAREPSAVAAATMRVGDLEIDERRRIVTLAGRPVPLTRAEFDLLEELARHRDAVLSREQLLGAVHGDDRYIGRRTVDAHVKNVRAKLGDDAAAPSRLLTVYGVGYRLVDPAG